MLWGYKQNKRIYFQDWDIFNAPAQEGAKHHIPAYMLPW